MVTPRFPEKEMVVFRGMTTGADVDHPTTRVDVAGVQEVTVTGPGTDRPYTYCPADMELPEMLDTEVMVKLADVAAVTAGELDTSAEATGAITASCPENMDPEIFEAAVLEKDTTTFEK